MFIYKDTIFLIGGVDKEGYKRMDPETVKIGNIIYLEMQEKIYFNDERYIGKNTNEK